MIRSVVAATATVAAVLLLAPFAAAERPLAAPQPLLLASAACAVQTAAAPSAALAPAGAPDVAGLTSEPLWMEHCNATQDCPDGSKVSCQGHQSCTVQTTSVTCDTVVTSCPSSSCTAPLDCREPQAYCDCRAAGGSFMNCNSEHCKGGCGLNDPACP
jgi:hypothetical protein